MKKSLILFLVVMAGAVMADEIHLNDGRVIKGRIIQITPKHVEYDPEGDIVFNIFPRGQILKIVYDDGKEILLNEGNSKEDKIDEKKKQHDKPSTDEKPSRRSDVEPIHKHEGFLFRAHYGGGMGNTEVTGLTEKSIEYSGTTSMLRLKLGYTIYDNLIVFGTTGMFMIGKPDVKQDGNEVEDKNASVSIFDIGIGLTYYIMPINIYVSASINSCDTTFDGDTIEGQSDSGTGYYISAGKEWWISKNWGIGIAVFYHYSSMDAKVEETNQKFSVENQVFGIAFTATYN